MSEQERERFEAMQGARRVIDLHELGKYERVLIQDDDNTAHFNWIMATDPAVLARWAEMSGEGETCERCGKWARVCYDRYTDDTRTTYETICPPCAR